VRTQREYGALLHEIDTVKAQIRGLEEQAFQAMERHEQAQKQAAEERARFAELDERYSAELARWEAEKPSVVELAERERSTVEELRRAVPPPLLSRFDRLRERHRGEALAPIRRLTRVGRGPEIFSCGVCNYRVRPQVVVEIRNQGTLIECDSCKRILYLASDV
jgi:predicted  nucleic acid-binding Zn-ribbon protein